MPDHVLKRPARKSAGVAVFASVSVHVLLLLGLWFVTADSQEKAPSLTANDLIVVVGEEDRIRASDGRHDVTLVSPEHPYQGETGFSPTMLQPRVVDAGPAAPPVDPGTEPVPRVRGTGPGVEKTRPGDGSSETPGPTGTSFFGASATGRSVVYVLDRSMSMGVHDGLRQARTELLASLSRLPATTRFQIIAYNQIAEPLSINHYGGLLTADADTLSEVARALAALRATGGTKHVQALISGLNFRPDVLFFVTDADELTATDVDEVSRHNGGRCSIHVIDLSLRPDDPVNALRRLALQNRGTYRRVGVKEL